MAAGLSREASHHVETFLARKHCRFGLASLTDLSTMPGHGVNMFTEKLCIYTDDKGLRRVVRALERDHEYPELWIIEDQINGQRLAVPHRQLRLVSQRRPPSRN